MLIPVDILRIGTQIVMSLFIYLFISYYVDENGIFSHYSVPSFKSDEALTFE